MTDKSWLVLGLGNPGPRYAETRHNLGAWVVDRLVDRLGARLRKVRFLPLEVAEAFHRDARLLLARPQTFMNESGPPVASFVRRRRLEPGSIVACHDEIDLPFGSLRVKRGGSTAGHRGLDSVAGAFRTKDFHRVRIGVGRPPGRKEAAGHVLGPFTKVEREEANVLIEDAADAVLSLIRDGLAATQDRHNRTSRSG
jgi:peptidyl-tRNA hydrolase, PTH1 family